MWKQTVQWMTLPLRTFLYGLDVAAQTLQGFQKIGAETLGTAAGQASPTARPALAPLGRSATFPRVDSPAADPRLSPVTGGVEDAVKRKPSKEVRDMCSKCGHVSCSCRDYDEGPCNPVTCDQDLSVDCCVKVVQYVIISVLQGINDNERVLVGPKVVAFSDSMTTDGFVSWIIAENCDRLKEYDKKYLRVSFCVQGRFPVSTLDLAELQVAALVDIANELKHKRELPPKK